MTQALPSDDFTDVGRLVQLFHHTTNAYKYLFFLALLEQIAEHPTDDAPRIPVRTLVEGALALAWYPHTYFRLSFGSQDKVGRVLTALSASDEPLSGKLTPLDLTSVRALIHQRLPATSYKDLSRWVQFRLLTPWFRDELRGLKDSAKNRTIAQLSRQTFERSAPLYRLENDHGDELQLHPDWVAYIRRNHAPLRDWARWQWLLYMQARNPAVPNVAGKLLPPLARDSLTRQRSYWQGVIGAGGVSCVFTGAAITSLDALDHFLPWSFVLHDRLWNLMPLSTSVNSSKCAQVPDMRYLPGLAALQAHALVTSARLMTPRSWEGVALEYVDDLHVPMDVLRAGVHEPSQLVGALLEGYERMVRPLSQIAEHQGFVGGWGFVDELAGVR